MLLSIYGIFSVHKRAITHLQSHAIFSFPLFCQWNRVSTWPRTPICLRLALRWNLVVVCPKCSRASCRLIDGHREHQLARSMLSMLSLAFPTHFVETEFFELISAKVKPLCAKPSFSGILRLCLGLYYMFWMCVHPSLFPHNSKNNVSTAKA